MSLLRDISLDIEAPLGTGGMAEVYKARDTPGQLPRRQGSA